MIRLAPGPPLAPLLARLPPEVRIATLSTAEKACQGQMTHSFAKIEVAA